MGQRVLHSFMVSACFFSNVIRPSEEHNAKYVYDMELILSKISVVDSYSDTGTKIVTKSVKGII